MTPTYPTTDSARNSIRILKILSLLAIVSLVQAIFIGCGKGDSQPLPGGRGGPEGISVETLVLEPRPIERKIITTGSLMANEEVELRPEISGRVTGVFFEEGKKVKKGDLLLKLNDRELQAQLKRKQLEETLAADDERRKRSLFEINGISKEDYDKVLYGLNMIRAEVEVIESQLAETEIYAPFDGVVGLRHVSEGSVISSNTLVATLQDIDPIKVEFSIPEKYTGDLKVGTGIAVQTGDSASVFEGKVYAVESKVDPDTRTLKARARIPNPDGRLIPGLFGKIEITLERIADAIVIPTRALIPELNSQKVFLSKNGKAVSCAVETGIRTDQEIQITGGLTAGDTLILTGLLQLRDGRPVKTAPPTPN